MHQSLFFKAFVRPVHKSFAFLASFADAPVSSRHLYSLGDAILGRLPRVRIYCPCWANSQCFCMIRRLPWKG